MDPKGAVSHPQWRHSQCPCVRAKRCGAFTLVELLVVIAILSALMAMLLPILREAQIFARAVSCMNQVRQINVGLADYLADHKEYMMWVRSGGNPSTCQTSPFAPTWSGTGALYGGGYVEDQHVLFCPDMQVGSAWASGDPQAARRKIIREFPAKVMGYQDTREDYNLGYWGGAPKLDEFLRGTNFGRVLSGRRAVFWIADGCSAFAYYY